MDTTSFVRAIDGDTLETWINTSRVGIGIIGIDAPEGNTICGIQATDYIQELVYGGLHLEEDPVIAFDQAFRRMYYAYTPSGESVAALMAASGLVDVTGEGKEADLLQALHAEAEATQTGCFADPDADLNTMGTLQGNLDAAGPSLLQSTILPPDLAQDTVVPGLSFPTSFSFFPDGRILIGEKSGLVHVFKDGALLSTPFIDIRSQVNNYWDRGLLNVAVDPNFDSNGYVYLLYTYENNASEFSSAKTGRLIRVTANGDTASLSTAVTLLGSVVGTTCPAYTDDCIPSDSTSHSTGGIAFGADGTLFVTLGDGAEFNVVDPNALRAQHPDSLAGKLLRITNAGQGLPDNPFFTGDPNDNRSKVWASGLRNAYRLSVNPANGVPYLGDVGWNTWEETSAAPSGSNLGWPCYEGPALQGGYESYSECESLYALGSTAVQPPLVYWNHNGGGSAVTGGVFIDSDKYSAPYRNAYLYADYVAGSISYIHVDANNAVVSGPSLLASNAAGPVDFEIGPDGYLYYLAINTGEVRRITPVDTLPEPGQDVYVSDLAWLSATNGWGPVERDMSNGEDAAGDGNPLSIRGNVFQKGIGAHSTSVIEVDLSSVCPVFTAVVGIDDEAAPNGTVSFEVWGDETLMYASSVLSGASAPVNVRVDLSGHSTMRLVTTEAGDNNWWDHANWAGARFLCVAPVDEAPVATITTPTPDYLFSVGDEILFAGEATDSAGNSIDPSGYSWRVILHHCSGTDCHTHQLLEQAGVTSGTFTVPEHGIDTWHLEVELTATQPDGQSTTTSREIFPNTVTVSLDSTPSGLIVSFGAVEGAAPLAREIVVGSEVTVQAPSPQGAYVFESWSDGGAQQHNIIVGGSDVTLTAVFSGEEEPPPPPPEEPVYISDIQWVSETNGWGPVERDSSNGEDGANDGNPITMGGIVYGKGIGVHSPSEVVIDLTGLCQVFTAVIGIDDEVGSNGSVTFEVWGASTLLYQSGELTGTMSGQTIQVDLSGYSTMRLVAREGENNWWDHANWADAQLTCSAEAPAPDPEPLSVTDVSPDDGAVGVAVSTVITATFSRAVDLTTLNADTVQLVQQGESIAESTSIAYDADTQQITLTPSSSLLEATIYTVTVLGGESGVLDTSSIGMQDSVSWSFTTESASGGTEVVTMRVASLEDISSRQGGRWTASVRITVQDTSGEAVSGASVQGAWSEGASGSASCTTGSSGTCTVAKTGIANNVQSVTFTVSGLTHDTLQYDAAGNFNSGQITVTKP